MRNLTSVACALAIGLTGLGACSSDTDGTDTSTLKQDARKGYQNPNQASASDTAVSRKPDLCAIHKWYGNGECDCWCPEGDRDDCTVGSGGDVACAEFWSPADGY